MDQSILALVAFTFSASMTPGPNNIMLMTSGVNFGFRRTVPHMLGVVLGFPFMIAIIGVGFGATILALPWFHDIVSALGIPYLLWLAWHIAEADTRKGLTVPVGLMEAGAQSSAEVEPRSSAIRSPAPRPMSFIAASAFQWVNAKAWVMAVGMLALYAPQGYGVVGGIAIVVGITLILSVMSCVTWTAFGSALSVWLANPLRLKIFNITMAALLVATLVPPILDLWKKYG